MKLLRICFLLAMFHFVAAGVSAQDVIVYNDGTILVCRVTEVSDTDVKYKKWTELDGSLYSVGLSYIKSIQYENGDTDYFNGNQPVPAASAVHDVSPTQAQPAQVPATMSRKYDAEDYSVWGLSYLAPFEDLGKGIIQVSYNATFNNRNGENGFLGIYYSFGYTISSFSPKNKGMVVFNIGPSYTYPFSQMLFFNVPLTFTAYSDASHWTFGGMLTPNAGVKLGGVNLHLGLGIVFQKKVNAGLFTALTIKL